MKVSIFLLNCLLLIGLLYGIHTDPGLPVGDWLANAEPPALADPLSLPMTLYLPYTSRMEPVVPTPTTVPPTPIPPTPVPPTPTSTPVPADPTPTPVPSDPTPTPVPSDPTPTPVPSNPTPTPVPSDPTPTPVPPTPTPTSTPTPTPTPAPQVSLVNGNFESGHVGWSEYSYQGYPLINPQPDLPIPPRAGYWAAWLGGTNNETAVLSQRVTIPWDRPYLTYWMVIGSTDSLCEYDVGGVLFDDTVVDAYYLCKANETGGWIFRVIDLRAFAGRTGTLEFGAVTGLYYHSSLFLDEIAFRAPGMTQVHPGAHVPEDDTFQPATARPGREVAEQEGNPITHPMRSRLLEALNGSSRPEEAR